MMNKRNTPSNKNGRCVGMAKRIVGTLLPPDIGLKTKKDDFKGESGTTKLSWTRK